MIKIVLKEPVGGMISGNNVSARSVNYLEAQGDVNDDLVRKYDSALRDNECLIFMSPSKHNFLIPAQNIAYLIQTDAK